MPSRLDRLGFLVSVSLGHHAFHRQFLARMAFAAEEEADAERRLHSELTYS